MSKLADLIRRSTRTEAPTLGFGAGSRKQPPTMLIVGLASDHWARAAGDANGADALLLTGRLRDQDIADAVSTAGDKACGAVIADAEGDALARMRGAGLDFAVLTTQSPASALLDDELGFVLQLREELNDIQLRTLESRPLDAIFLEHDTHPLTIRRQIDFQRISALARKPLLVPVRPNVEESDLLALRESGATLVTLDLSERGASDALPRLRSLIDALPARRKPRSEDREVSILGAVHASQDEDDFDE